jgi:hypothetical protein
MADLTDKKEDKLNIAFPQIDPSLIDKKLSANPAKYVSKQKTLSESLAIVNVDFARIGKMIELLWGSQELQTKLESMVRMDRPERQGFPVPVGLALMNIYIIHMEEFHFEPKGIWTKTWEL